MSGGNTAGLSMATGYATRSRHRNHEVFTIFVLALRQRMPCGSSTYYYLEGLGAHVHGSYGV